MKCLYVLLMFGSCFYLRAQEQRFESTYFDSLVWQKINKYRMTKSVKPFVYFEDSLMRDFCQRVTYRNALVPNPAHSDSVGYWSNAECLYTFISSGFKTKEMCEMSKLDLFELLAERTVQAWIHSPTHERAISRPEYNTSTIVAVLIIDPVTSSLRLDVTYHALDKEHNTFNRYVYR